ncbi:MAG TPA: hypothetical protein VGD37_31010 [Kofleriaceae bacterium]|jgi:hypothetical protein
MSCACRGVIARPSEIDRQAEELVAHRIALRGRDVDRGERWRVLIDAEREAELLVEHELVQALHRAAGAGLELDRDDAAAGLDQKVDLTRPAAFALPVEQARSVAGGTAAGQKGLTDELLGELTADSRREVAPGRKLLGGGGIGERVEQADVEQDRLAELVRGIATERDARGGAVGRAPRRTSGRRLRDASQAGDPVNAFFPEPA